MNWKIVIKEIHHWSWLTVIGFFQPSPKRLNVPTGLTSLWALSVSGVALSWPGKTCKNQKIILHQRLRIRVLSSNNVSDNVQCDCHDIYYIMCCGVRFSHVVIKMWLQPGNQSWQICIIPITTHSYYCMEWQNESKGWVSVPGPQEERWALKIIWRSGQTVVLQDLCR